MPLNPGTTLGSYSVTAKIGEGGMGEVYRARDTKLDWDVALKVLSIKTRRRTCWPARACLAAALVATLGVAAVAQEPGWENFERGRFSEASRWASETLAQQPEHQRARHLRILTSFLSGQYEDALAQYLLLPAGYSGRDEALTRVILNAYLHLDRYQEAAAFAHAMALPDAERAWLDVRAANPPTVQLDGTTVVPFAEENFLGDLMPAVEVELNGIPLVAHLDTGGAFITMATSRAEELGIEVRPVGTGVANNRETNVSRGLADSLAIGDAVLTDVQVSTVESLTGQLESLVILGTRILSSFLTTWDNEQGRLILTPRGDDALRSRHLAAYAGDTEATDLYLHGDHFLWVNGRVDGHDALMFLDTGLVTLDPRGEQPAGGIRREALKTWAVPFADGFTESVTASVGPVSRAVSSFSVFPDGRNLANLNGASPDALISHGFFKHYVWTMDFDDRKLFLHPVRPGHS